VRPRHAVPGVIECAAGQGLDIVPGIVLVAVYLATPLLVVMGVMPLLVAVPLAGFVTYASYTVLHDAAHGSISGSHTSLRWVNEALGYIAAGFRMEGVALFAIGWLLGVALVMFLFAYIVHTPHAAVGRYVDTSTIVIDGPAGKLATLLWGFQNYHSIHHLFPRIPFYTYRAVFEEIEAVMVARGAPIYCLGLRGMHSRKMVSA